MSAHPIGVCGCKGTKKIANAQGLCDFFLQENKCVGKQTSPREEACESIMYEGLLWTNSTNREAKASQVIKHIVTVPAIYQFICIICAACT